MGALVGAVAAVLLASTAAGGGVWAWPRESGTWVPREEAHYVMAHNGRVIGVRHVAVREGSSGGKRAFLSEIREETRISTRGVTSHAVTVREELVDEQGLAIALRETREEAGQVVDLAIAVQEGKAVFRTRVAGRERELHATCEGPVRFDLDGEAFAARGELEPGRTLRSFVVARVELGIAELEARVLERLEASPGGPGGTRIRVSNVNAAGEPWDVFCDASGRTTKIVIGPMVVQRVGPEEARLPRTPPVLENRIPTERVTRLDEIRSMRVEATTPPDAQAGLFTSSVYCKAWREPDGSWRLELSEARPDGRLPLEELSEADRRRFTAGSPMIESDERAIAELAGRIAGGEPEPLKRALFIARWVYRNLSKRSAGPSTASALETLRARAGDCTEHAALFTALARAAGLPARQAMGLVHDGEGFQFHAWAEVFAEGSWIPVDPTLGRFGVSAVYILLGREGDLVEYHTRANALQGRTSMSIVDAN